MLSSSKLPPLCFLHRVTAAENSFTVISVTFNGCTYPKRLTFISLNSITFQIMTSAKSLVFSVVCWFVCLNEGLRNTHQTDFHEI